MRTLYYYITWSDSSFDSIAFSIPYHLRVAGLFFLRLWDSSDLTTRLPASGVIITTRIDGYNARPISLIDQDCPPVSNDGNDKKVVIRNVKLYS